MASHDKNRREFHPAVSISSWLIAALAIELASSHQLAWLAAAALVLLADARALRGFARLLWRARWLWLALLALYAWTVPGILLWPSDYSPSREGLEAGLVRVARLVLMLAVLARLLAEFTPVQLAGGLYLLAKPFAALGLDRRALAVRLALTLEQLEQPDRNRNWLAELNVPAAKSAGPEEMRMAIAQAGLKDVLVLFAAIALLGLVLARTAA